jgi:hypothetical protein
MVDVGLEADESGHSDAPNFYVSILIILEVVAEV